MKRLPAFFYALPSGREPVREWLKELSAADRKIVGEDIKDVEFAWPIGMPLCRSLGKGLWEVRSNLMQGRIARVLFCERDGMMVLCTLSSRRHRRRRQALSNWQSSERGKSHEKNEQARANWIVFR
jgi:hypothetical protein